MVGENRNKIVRDTSDEKDRKVGCCLGRIVSPSLISKMKLKNHDELQSLPFFNVYSDELGLYDYNLFNKSSV
jgi:hypothetical protein